MLDTDHFDRCFDEKPPVYELKRLFWMKFCTTFVNPGMNLLRNMIVEVEGGSKIVNHCNSQNIMILKNQKASEECNQKCLLLYVKIWRYFRGLLSTKEFLQHCLFCDMCKRFSVFGVHFEHFEKNNCHSPAWIKFFV